MYAVVGHGVEENGEGCDQCLAFARCHLGNLALVQDDAAEQLHVVVNHIPAHRVAASQPRGLVDGLVALDGDEVLGSCEVAVHLSGSHLDCLVVGEAVGRLLDDGEDFGQDFGQLVIECLQNFLLQVVDFGPYLFALVHVKFFDVGAQFLDFCAVGRYHILHLLHESLAAGAQFVVRQFFNGGVGLLDLIDPRLDGLHVALRLVAEQFR